MHARLADKCSSHASGLRAVACESRVLWKLSGLSSLASENLCRSRVRGLEVELAYRNCGPIECFPSLRCALARGAGGGRVVALAPRALIAEFDLDSDLDSESDSEGEGGDEEGFFGEGGFLGSDYDSDDNSTAAQVHRFFTKVEGLGIDLGEDVFSDPWA